MNEKIIAANIYGTCIPNCVNAICYCGYSLGIPEDQVTDVGKWYSITCPHCGFELQLFGSTNSVYKGQNVHWDRWKEKQIYEE